MSYTTKYQKIDADNIREWKEADIVLNKQELLNAKSNLNILIESTNNELIAMGHLNPEAMRMLWGAKKDEIDTQLPLFDGSATPEELNFIGE